MNQSLRSVDNPQAAFAISTGISRNGTAPWSETAPSRRSRLSALPESFELGAVSPDIEARAPTPRSNGRQGIESEGQAVTIEERSVIDDLRGLGPSAQLRIEQPFVRTVRNRRDARRRQAALDQATSEELAGHEHMVGGSRRQTLDYLKRGCSSRPFSAPCEFRGIELRRKVVNVEHEGGSCQPLRKRTGHQGIGGICDLDESEPTPSVFRARIAAAVQRNVPYSST